MTFDNIVALAASRLNLSSAAAITRIGIEVNDRYRRVTSSVGINAARRATDIKTTIPGTAEITFNLEKLEIVYVPNSDGNRRVLQQVTYDDWRNADTWAPTSGIPFVYAIKNQGAGSVTIELSPTPASTFNLNADGLAPLVDLSGAQVPVIPADFHDILMHGAIADELRKMEKTSEALEAEKMYEGRLSDLRMFIAKSAYLAMVQGGRSGLRRGAYWPGYAVQRWGL